MGKYSAYTAAFKLKVISYAEEHGIRAAGRHFCIAEFNVRYWNKQKDALGRAKMSSKAFRGPKTGRYPEIERDLLVYVKWMRNCGGVTSDMLLSKAREISRKHGVEASQFKVSRGWLSGFMKRHGLTLRRGQFSGLKDDDDDDRTAVVGGPAAADAIRLPGEPQGRMLVMETEQHIKEESSSVTKGAASIKSTLTSSREAEEAELEAAIVEEEEEVGEEEVEEQVEEVVEDEDDDVLLGGEEEEKLLAAGSEEEEGITLPDEDLEACVVKEVVVEESGTPPSLSASELVAEIEEEVEEEEEGAVGYEEGDCARTEEDLLKEDDEGNMLVEVAAGHGVEGEVVGKEGVSEGKKDVVVGAEKQEKESVVQAEAKDSEGVGLGSEDNSAAGRTKDGLKDGSPLKVAGQLGSKESLEDFCEKKSNGQSKETLSNSKVKKEPKEATESTPKTAAILGFKGTAVSGDHEEMPPAAVKIEPQEETEEGTSKHSRGMKGEVDSSNPASDDYEEEGHEDGAEETPEEESHGEKRSCLGDSGGLSSEESGDVCCKRRRVETSTDAGGGVSDGARGGSHHRGNGRGRGGGEESKDCVLTGDSEKEGGGGSDESLDRKMERLKKEIHLLGVMAKQKELEWDEIIRAKKTKEENLIRLRRRRRIVAISREAALAERRRHRREGRRARTEADLSSEEEGTDEEWYMQIRGMTGAALPGSRAHAGVGSGPRPSPGRMPNRNAPGSQGSPLMGLNSSTLSHSTVSQSMPLSTASVPSIVSTTYIQRMHRPILPKPPNIPGGPMNRRNAAVQQSSPVSVTTSIANPLIPATVPSNGSLSGNGCGSLDGSQNTNQVIGEGRQGPILDVRSIIADYRSRHPETVPLRGRRNKSLTPSPAAASSLREGGSAGGAGSDGGPCENPASTEASMSAVTSTPGILNIASLALGSGSQVRTRGIQAQDVGAPDISYLLLSAGNGCPPGGTLPIRHQPPPRESSRPSSTESSRSGGQAIPPVTLPAGGALVDSSGNFSFKDVLVQFARMSQTEQQQQMMAVIPGMGGQGLLPSAPTTLPPQVSVPSRQPRHILPSTTTTTVLPGPLVTPARPPPPPYPEVTLLPVLVAGNEGNPSVRPAIPPELAAPQPRSTLPPPTPSLLQMSLSAPTSTPRAPSPPSTSLLHGILTKSGTGLASSSGLGSSSSGPSPRATAFAPTLARLLTAPEKQPSLSSVRPTPPSTTGSSVLGSQAFVSIGELLQTSKAKNEITITPVSGAQPSLLKQQPQQPQQPITNLPAKEDTTSHMEEEQDDSTDRLVIDESIAASEGDGRRQSRQRQASMASAAATAMVPEGQEGMADEEEVEEEEVAMEEEEGDGMEEEDGDGMEEEDEGEEGPVPECQGCHSRAAQFVCAGCGNQWYCSRDCQVSAWDEHSEVCSG